MIWLTWRQFRTQGIAGATALVLVLAATALTWASLSDLARATGFTGCVTGCEEVSDAFLTGLEQSNLQHVYWVGAVVLILVPALVGVFWGAPLAARELEAGTYRMVWSQSVSRGRWLLVKLGGVGLAAAALAGLISLAVTWWAGPIDQASGTRITPMLFSARGIVPIGYAVLAFVLGVLTGLVLRRTVTAMAVTLLLVTGLQLAMPFLVRPVIAQPVIANTALDTDRLEAINIRDDIELLIRAEPAVRGAWLLSNRTLDASGKVYTGPVDPARCGRTAQGGPRGCEAWIAEQNLRVEQVYVPAEKFWTVQWREFGLLVLLTAGLSGLALWWIRRRLA